MFAQVTDKGITQPVSLGVSLHGHYNRKCFILDWLKATIFYGTAQRKAKFGQSPWLEDYENIMYIKNVPSNLLWLFSEQLTILQVFLEVFPAIKKFIIKNINLNLYRYYFLLCRYLL